MTSHSTPTWPSTTTAIQGEPSSGAPSPLIARAATWLAIALVYYFVAESPIEASLSSSWFWGVRLAPDIAVGLVTIWAVLASFDRRGNPYGALIATVAFITALVMAEAIRGAPLSDAINAVRVVVRYALLAAVLANHPNTLSHLWRRLRKTIYLLGTLEAALVVAQAALGAAGHPSNTLQRGAWLPAGTFDRYDRLGLFLMAASLLVTCETLLGTSRYRTAILALGLIDTALVFSTSRQAAIGVVAGALAASLLVRAQAHRWRHATIACFALATVAAVSVSSASDTLRQAPDYPVSTRREPPAISEPYLPRMVASVKGSSALSLDCNDNFRLWLNFVMLPWAATQEPFLGFGPSQHDAAYPDARLYNFAGQCGSSWEWVRHLTSDSNYASLVIQFGLLGPGILIFFLVRSAVLSTRPHSRLTAWPTSMIAACLVAALFGPVLEIRSISEMLWLGLAIRAQSQGTLARAHRHI